MSKSYYLMNGNNRVGQVVNVKVGEKVKREFEDIAILDLATMDIKDKEAKDILREVNPGNPINGMFYDLWLQGNQKVNAYAPIFNYDKPILEKYYNELRHFAELRSVNVIGNKSVKLDYNSRLDEFVRDMLCKIIDNNIQSLTEYDSLISFKLKKIIKEKSEGMYYCSSANRYLDSKSKIIKNLLSNYTELRNLTLSYIIYLSGNKTGNRSLIERTENWNNLGITKEAFQDNIINCQQMELADYINAPRVLKLDKKGNPIL